MAELTELEKLMIKGNKKLNIVDGEEFRNSMKTVAFLMAEKVNKTLGPYAHTTIIDDGYNTYPTKDGWNIINRMEFEDQLLMSICKIIRTISFHLVTKVGDGTSTALCVASKFISLLDAIPTNARQADIVKTLEDIVADCETILTSDPAIHWNIDLDTEEGLENILRIARVSSNYNEEISQMIYQIYKETKNPNIHVEIDAAEKSHYTITRGFKMNGKCLNIDMIRNTDDGSCHMNGRTAVLMIDHNVTYARHLKLVMEAYNEAIGRMGAQMMVVMAPNYDETFLYQMSSKMNAMRQQNQRINLALLQVPVTKQAHRDVLEDLAVIGNCQVFNGMDLETISLVEAGDVENHKEDFERIASMYDMTEEMILRNPYHPVLRKLGMITGVNIGPKEFMCAMVDSDRFKVHFGKVQEDFKALKARREKSSSTTDIEFTDAYMRYCRLIGNMGYIKIGGKSPLEKSCLKDAVDDAVLACKAAAEKGFVRGMNISTIESLAILISKIHRDTVTDENGNRTAVNFEGNYTGSPERDELFYTLCNVLMVSYKYATAEIFKNKYVPNGTDEEITEETQKVFRIIDNCAATRSVYNLITEEYEKIPGENGTWDTVETMETNFPGETVDVHYVMNVVNPVSTDIEVLKAAIGILSHILTSNQIETMGKFMRNMKTEEDRMEDDIRKWTQIGANVTSYYLSNRNAETDAISRNLEAIMNRLDQIESKLDNCEVEDMDSDVYSDEEYIQALEDMYPQETHDVEYPNEYDVDWETK